MTSLFIVRANVLLIVIFIDAEIAFCYSNPCNNGGSCVEGHGTYTCICRKGFKGNTCDGKITRHANVYCISTKVFKQQDEVELKR